MELTAVVDHVRHIADVRGDGAAPTGQIEAALRSLGRLEAWLAGSKAALTSQLSAQVSFPEKTIAECTRGTTRDAFSDIARADTLDTAPSLADALDEARVTAGHVDK